MASPANPNELYFPDAAWQRRTPSDAGVDPRRLEQAIAFAIAGETRAPRDLVMNHYQNFGREPFGYAIGPIKERGEPTGLIIHRGRIIAEWGDPLAVEMTHSVTKSFLSTIVGIAVDRGLINRITDPVRDYVGPVLVYNPLPGANKSDRLDRPDLLSLFDTPHNRGITWDDLLRQTSDWEGTLWGKPDWADRPAENPAEWRTRPRHKPGSVYQYNDVRTNVLALAALNVWRRPLPQVLKENVMDPIGASNSWRWFGYENSWIVLDGVPVQSVTGGGHWGGGMFINAYDMARFGYLTLRNGCWKDRRLLSGEWIDQARTPTAPEPIYGFMNWFLNTDRKRWPSAPATAFAHVGNGTNLVYVDPDHDLVAVVRWIDTDAIDGFLGLLVGATAG
ncbi:MAG: class beta-lactamase-related serine hydrolase [Rhodospirillales bacterium]|nr:class beta-lactamase-related serine hydrolase [Rhodospirillales bacterium]